MKKNEITIIVDSREQTPYVFENSIVKGLKTGDYAPLGYETECAVERKTLADFAQSVTLNRDRFEREIVRAKEGLNFFAIVIEIGYHNIWREYLKCKVSRKALLATIHAWTVKYNIPIIMGGNRAMCNHITKSLCESYVKYKENLKYTEVFELTYGDKE